MQDLRSLLRFVGCAACSNRVYSTLWDRRLHLLIIAMSKMVKFVFAFMHHKLLIVTHSMSVL
ncbi:unnamed protein product [Rhodiola kirilowii]